jgi:hypothetical protein
MNKPFCVFVISHGRADNVVTLQTLKQCGYTGALFIICDNEDKTVDQYKKNYGADTVLVFDKLYYASLVDSCDNFQNRRTTTHARNACFDLAKERGFEYFLVLDDDYNQFRFANPKNGKFCSAKIQNINDVFIAMFNFLDCDERICSICFMQQGDMMGGATAPLFRNQMIPFRNRKAMNSFFCKTSRRFWFFSRLNEDVNTYLRMGSIGHVFLTIPDIFLQQCATQSGAGGMTDAYLLSGTYVKSFYSVMQFPSFVKIAKTNAMSRLHHWVTWRNSVPKILDDTHKKQ